MFLLPIIVLIVRVSPEGPRTLLSLLFSCLLVVGMPSSVGRGEQPDAQNNGLLRREGSMVTDTVGEVMLIGSRWAFIGTDRKTYRLLENLTLQRIVRSHQQDPTDKYWTIDGTITEFMDENFIQLSRAHRTSPSKRLPD